MTREEALLNAYLKGVKTDQSKAVSSGTQAVSSAASEGVKMMNQAANVHIPSMYDYSKDMYKLIQEQQEEQIKAQRAAQRAAASDAKKQQKEAEEKKKSQQKAKQAAQAESQQTSQEKTTTAKNSGTRYSGIFVKKKKSPEELQNEARQNYYDTTRRMGEISSKINSLDGEEGKLMSRREKAAEKKDLEAELEKISDSLRPIVKQLPDDERAAAYAESWYVLSDEEKKDAKQLAKNYTSREYVQSIYDPVTKTNRPKEFQMNQIGEKLKFKTSLAGGFWSGLVSSIPFYNESVEKYSPEIYDTLQAAKTQNPKSSIAGNIAGSLGGYALGSAAVKAIPGVGAAAAKAGQALGATKGAAQLQKIPVLGRAFTGEALTGIIADQMADTVLDTIPTTVQSVRENKPASAVAMDAAGNFGVNALMNIGAEGVLGSVGDALKRRQKQRIPVVETPENMEYNTPIQQLKPEMQADAEIGRQVQPRAETGPDEQIGAKQGSDALWPTNVDSPPEQVTPNYGDPLDEDLFLTEKLVQQQSTPDIVLESNFDRANYALGFNAPYYQVTKTKLLYDQVSSMDDLTQGAEKLGKEFAQEYFFLTSPHKITSGQRDNLLRISETRSIEDFNAKYGTNLSVDDAGDFLSTERFVSNNYSPEYLFFVDVLDLPRKKLPGNNVDEMAQKYAQNIIQGYVSGRSEIPYLRDNSPSVEDRSIPYLREDLPESIGAMRTQFDRPLVPSQQNTIRSIDEQNLSPADIEIQGGPVSYMHERVSFSEQRKNAENILSTESIDEVLDRLDEKDAWNSEDTAVALESVRRMDEALRQMDKTTDEYRSLFYANQQAKQRVQESLSETGRTLGVTRMVKPSEAVVMDAQNRVQKSVEDLEKRTPKPFGDDVNKAKQAVKQAEDEAGQAAEKALQDELEKVPGAEALAKKVSATVYPKSKGENPVTAMVNELFRVAKESPIVQDLQRQQVSAVEKLQAAYQNAGQYREAWNQAKEIVRQKFQGDEDALEFLDDYLKNMGDNGLYSTRTTGQAMSETARSLGIDFRKLAKQGAKSKADALAEIQKKIQQAVGVSEDQAAQLAQRVKQVYDDALTRAVDQNLRQMLPELFGKKANRAVPQAYDKFISLLNMGRYDDDAVKQLVASKWGIAPLTPEQTDQITELIEQANKYPAKSRQRADLQAQAASIAASNINSSLQEKWDAWRYTAMLGNVRTNERNIIGNVSQAMLARAKEVVQASAEAGVDWIAREVLGTDGIQRTTAIISPLNTSDRALMAGAFKDADNAAYTDLIGGSEMFDISREMLKQGRVFNNNVLEGLRTGTSRALEGADYEGAWGALNAFANAEGNAIQRAAASQLEKVAKRGEEGWYGISGLRNNYAWSLSEYLKANGANAGIFQATDQASKELLDKARAWATQQALVNTYHEEEVISKAFNGLVKVLDEKGGKSGKAVSVALKGLLPFTKTPINILKSTYRYSPLGLLSAISKTVDTVRTGKSTAADVIDSVSKSAVGTAMFVLGGVLYKNGMLTSSMTEDERKAAEVTGQQEYSINFTGPNGKKYSYTIDWLSALSLPMLMGAELVKQKEQMGENDSAVDALVNAAAAMGDPLVKMSFLQSLDNAIQTASNVKLSENDSSVLALASVPVSALTSYATQGIPTIAGQVARGIDPLRRSTYTGQSGIKNVALKEVQKAKNRIPGLSMLSEPYIDPLGQEQENFGGNILGRLAYQMLSPGYISEVKDINFPVYPERPEYTVRYTDAEGNPVSHRWTPEEYTQISRIQGQKSKDWIESLYDYPLTSVLDQDQLVKQYEKGYSMAQDAAKRSLVPEIQQKYEGEISSGKPDLENRLKWIYDNFGEDMVIEALTAQRLIDEVSTTKSGNKVVKTKKENSIELLMQYGYTREQAEDLYSLLTESDSLF